MSDYKFGLGGSAIDGLEFKEIWAKVFSSEGTGNPVSHSEDDPNVPDSIFNVPGNPFSPNFPRAKGRITGFQNPILGDSGAGSIKRGQTIKMDALENVIEYIIENYLKDREWYKKVRSRESLWNMYRRLQWWVEEQNDPSKSQYQRCLEMIKDCIYKILDPASELDIDDFLNPSGKTLTMVEGYVSSGQFDSFWNGFSLTSSSGQVSKVTRKYNASTRGDIMFQYSSDMDVLGSANIKINGVKVWEIKHPSQGNEFAHRDVKIEIASPQAFTIEFEVVGGGTYPCKLTMLDMDWIGIIQEKDDLEVPYCALPYEHRFDVDYFNHFDGSVIERPVLDMRDLPKLSGFPDFFRYMSSTEDAEWELVDSPTNDNVMKIDLSKLIVGNQSKITWNWRFKREGYVEFKYMASMFKGNTASFFINDRHVGGSWSESNAWETVKFYVDGNQLYKFDLLVRKNRPEEWGHNALLVKDVRLMEVIKSEKAPAPPTAETYGELVSDKWFMFKSKSVMASYYEGFADGEEDLRRQVIMSLDNECDGTVCFEYKVGVADPNSEQSFWLFVQDFLNLTGGEESVYGSSIQYIADSTWKYNGDRYSTTTNGAKIGYDLVVGDHSKVAMQGEVALKIPPMAVDHYIKVPKAWTVGGALWNREGINGTKWLTNSNNLTLSNPVTGYGTVSTPINMANDGFIEFKVDEHLKDGESLQIIVDGNVFGTAINGDGLTDYFRVPLSKGNHTVGFKLNSAPTTVRDMYEYQRRVTYSGSNSTYPTPGGNELYLRRFGYTDDDTHIFEGNGRAQLLEVDLSPGSSFYYKERINFMPYVAPDPVQPTPTKVLEELFNSQSFDGAISTLGSWNLIDWFTAFQVPGSGDGILFNNASSGSHKIFVDLKSQGFEQGYFEFEYGAKFGGSGKLVVKADGTEIWSTRSSDTSRGGTTVRLELPPYSEVLEFIYYA